MSDADLLSTFTELTAKQIALACARFGGPNVANGMTDDVLLRGGVCNNSYFVERLRANFVEQVTGGRDHTPVGPDHTRVDCASTPARVDCASTSAVLPRSQRLAPATATLHPSHRSSVSQL